MELVPMMSKTITEANEWYVLRIDAGREPDGMHWDKPTSYFRWSLIDGRTGENHGRN
jgi:hypothetical protein